MKTTFIVILVLFLFSCKSTKTALVEHTKSGSSDSEDYKGPIIDMHMHAYNSHSPTFGETLNPTTGEKRRGSENQNEHMLETFKVMTENNIVLAMISSVDEDNKVLLEWRKKKPDKILIGQSIVNPKLVNFDSLRLKIIRDDVKILGEIMPNYAGILPTDPSVSSIFKLAEEMKLPLGYHLFPGGPPGSPYFAFPSIRAVQAKPLQMEELLLKHPSIRVYIMHAGWPFLEDMKALMFAHQQVYVDLSVICWGLPRNEFYSFLKGLLDAGYGKRIMFGSDQMTWPKEITKGIEAINSAKFLTTEQKADIFYFNAARFLGLSEKQIEDHHNSLK